MGAGTEIMDFGSAGGEVAFDEHVEALAQRIRPSGSIVAVSMLEAGQALIEARKLGGVFIELAGSQASTLEIEGEAEGRGGGPKSLPPISSDAILQKSTITESFSS